jgi:hypothetical protein
MAATARPQTLDAEFKIESLDDVDAALHELGWCQHREAAIDAETKAKIEAIKTAQSKLKELSFGLDDEAATTLEKRAATLTAALLKWSDKHLQKHLPKGSKTLQLAHGELSLKLQPLSVVFAEGVKEKDVYAELDRKTKFFALVLNLLKKITLGQFNLSQIIRLKPDINKDALKDAWERNPKSRGTLKGLGLVVIGGADAVAITPAKVKVSNAA